MIDEKIKSILERALDGRAPSKLECAALINAPTDSIEAGVLRSVADAVSRRRFSSEAMIFGQIGIEISACPGRCRFCGFGEGQTSRVPSTMPEEEVLSRARDFTATGELSALFLMTTDRFDFARLLKVVRAVRGAIPAGVRIVANIGDFDLNQARELKSSGADGAYHILRLREGADTALDPARRMNTVRNIREAGMDWYYCCEPIGPEHSAQEIVDQLFIGVEHGCVQHAAMRRVRLPDVPLAAEGEITELRLAQVVAVVALASLACKSARSIAVHEPNLLGLTAGANVIWAETGANPRDTKQDTAAHRGWDVAACRRILCEAGFAELVGGDGRRQLLSVGAKGKNMKKRLD